VRCGECDAGLALEADIVTIQNYREEPSVRHFWVYCSFCATHKLYWPTVRQIVLADVLDCATLTDDELPDEIFASYQAGALMPPAATDDPAPAAIEIAFLLNMLAATSRVDPRKSPTQSYLPSHWSN
jgi:hypothetical protein